MRKILFFLTVFSILSSVTAQNNQFPVWRKGYLDIHFISTGRGNSTFILMPDGTSMLVDAGDLDIEADHVSQAVPSNSKSPAQWIADYIHQFHPKGKKAELDYVLITHYHSDHIGSFSLKSETYAAGGYKLSGITEVGSLIPVKKLIDSGNDFRQPEQNSETGRVNQLEEYRKFINYQEKENGLQYEKFKVGTNSQLKMKNSFENFPDFTVKDLMLIGTMLWFFSATYLFNGKGIKINF